MQTSAMQLFDVPPPDVCRLFDGSEPKADRVVKLLKYQKKDVAEATNVPLSSIRYDSKMPDELRVRFTEWAIAINLVASFFNDEDKALLWFQAPNPLLGGVSPRDMIRVGRFKKLLKFIQSALAENKR